MSKPDWLTEDYILAALRKFQHDDSIIIKSLHIVPALGKGENYGGILTRIKVAYELENGQRNEHKSYIVKTSYEEDEFSRDKMAPYDIFNREMSIYERVLPQLNALLAEIQDKDQLFATAVHVDYERQALIFEDLSERGYVMADRIKGLDMRHTQLILRKLAKMHATSAVLNERQRGCLESYDRGFFNRYTDNYSSYFVGMLVACGKSLQQQCSQQAHYGNKLLKLEPHYMEIGKRCFAPTPGHVNVLAHGDLWTNNVMFKYDVQTGAPIDVLLIDFQYTFWGSPTLDLHHFFNTSLQEKMRLHEQDKLFQYYHHFFADTLQKLKYQSHAVPTLYQFRLQVEQKRFFAFHSAVVIQPVMINERTENADFNAIMNENERSLNFRNCLYENGKVQQNLKNLLPVFERRGLLEIDQCE